MSKILSIASTLLMVAGPALADSDLRSSPNCLIVHDISHFSQGGRQNVESGQMTTIATTFENKQFRVDFQGICPYHLNSHFVYQQWPLGRCLKLGDALPLSTGGACMVQTVEQIPSDLPPGPGQGRHGTYK